MSKSKKRVPIEFPVQEYLYITKVVDEERYASMAEFIRFLVREHRRAARCAENVPKGTTSTKLVQ